jgi:hypothetical protein
LDCMFDLETLDTKPSAVILSLGAVSFDPKTLSIPDEMPRLMLRIDIDAQNDLGRTASDDTIEWWGKQPAHIQEEAFSEEGRTSLAESIDQFHKFVWNSDRIWSQGCFDIVIMEDLYRMVGRTPPWNYWQIRDSRTLFDFVDGKMDRSKHHDAMEDALEQARAVQRALHKIGWHGEKL